MLWNTTMNTLKLDGNISTLICFKYYVNMLIFSYKHSTQSGNQIVLEIIGQTPKYWTKSIIIILWGAWTRSCWDEWWADRLNMMYKAKDCLFPSFSRHTVNARTSTLNSLHVLAGLHCFPWGETCSCCTLFTYQPVGSRVAQCISKQALFAPARTDSGWIS